MVRKGRRIARSVRAFVSGKNKLSAYAFGHALGVVSIIGLLFYAVMSWFGDYDPSIIISQFPLGFSFGDWTIILGLIETYVISYIGGWIFVKIYNRVIR